MIDGKDAWTQWKIAVQEGGYAQLVCMPPMKDVETNDWNEHDGLEADLSFPVSEGRTFSLPMFCSGNVQNMDSLLQYLMTPVQSQEGINQGVYHTINAVEAGDYQSVVRFIGLSEVKVGNLRPPFLFSLTLAEDEGYSYSDQIVIPDADLSSSDNYKIDGIPLSTFGIKVLEGTHDSLRQGVTVKAGLSIDVSDEPGVIYDPGAYRKKSSRNINIKCLMRAASLSSMWNSYLSLKNLMFKSGYRTLACSSLDTTYKCHYVSCSVQEFYPYSIWLSFVLTFRILGWL